MGLYDFKGLTRESVLGGLGFGCFLVLAMRARGAP